MLTGIQIGPRQFELPPNMPCPPPLGHTTPDTPDRRPDRCRGVPGACVRWLEFQRGSEFFSSSMIFSTLRRLAFIQNRAQDSLFIARLQRVMDETISSGRAWRYSRTVGPTSGYFVTISFRKWSPRKRVAAPTIERTFKPFGLRPASEAHRKRSRPAHPTFQIPRRPNHPRSDHEKVFDEFHRETDIGRIGHRQLCR